MVGRSIGKFSRNRLVSGGSCRCNFGSHGVATLSNLPQGSFIPISQPLSHLPPSQSVRNLAAPSSIGWRSAKPRGLRSAKSQWIQRRYLDNERVRTDLHQEATNSSQPTTTALASRYGHQDAAQ
jgi:hypothetical protein